MANAKYKVRITTADLKSEKQRLDSFISYTIQYNLRVLGKRITSIWRLKEN